ncbi:MAG: cytochrome ubiquinol oxidase subunit I, partial [Lactococcus sp.]
MLTIETLARFQFGMTTIFHFFFVPLSIGLTLMTFIM